MYLMLHAYFDALLIPNNAGTDAQCFDVSQTGLLKDTIIISLIYEYIDKTSRACYNIVYEQIDCTIFLVVKML